MSNTDSSGLPRETRKKNTHPVSRRDWFAGQALAGLCSNCSGSGMFAWEPESVAQMAFHIADQMIEESYR